MSETVEDQQWPDQPDLPGWVYGGFVGHLDGTQASAEAPKPAKARNPADA